MTDEEIIAVVQAHKEGKIIQARVLKTSPLSQGMVDDNWITLGVNQTCNWNFEHVEYRVAPEPRKPKELWLIKDKENIWREYPVQQQGVGHVEQIRVREVMEPSRDQRTWFAEFPLDGGVGQIFTDPRQLTKGGKLVRVMEILD